MSNFTDYVKINDAAKVLGVSPATLRNWDSAGKLRAYRHPVNGYRLYREIDLTDLLNKLQRREKVKCR